MSGDAKDVKKYVTDQLFWYTPADSNAIVGSLYSSVLQEGGRIGAALKVLIVPLPVTLLIVMSQVIQNSPSGRMMDPSGRR